MQRGSRGFAALLVAALLAAVLASSCSSPDRDAAPPVKRLRISGAEITIPFIKALCDAYAKANRDVRCEFLPSSSTAGGLNGVAAGELDVAGISRRLTPGEKALGLREVWIAHDPIILVTHHGSQVDNLTSAQVRDIYSGKVTNWKALGGPDESIAVVDRPEHTSGKIVFRDTVLGPDLKVAPDAILVAGADEVHGAVLSTPGSIGYTSLSLFRTERSDLAIVRLDGVYPDETAVRSRAYAAVRPLGIAIAGEPSPALESFAAFAISPEGMAVARKQELYPW